MASRARVRTRGECNLAGEPLKKRPTRQSNKPETLPPPPPPPPPPAQEAVARVENVIVAFDKCSKVLRNPESWVVERESNSESDDVWLLLFEGTGCFNVCGSQLLATVASFMNLDVTFD